MSGLADQDETGQDKQVWPRAPTPSPAKRADPRGHWFLLAIGMLLAAGALVLNWVHARRTRGGKRRRVARPRGPRPRR